MRNRIIGFDVARAFAIFGMVVVNFKVVMNVESRGAPFFIWLSSLLEGRASALFIVLAGVGISYFTTQARVTRAPATICRNRWSIIKRGLFLASIGLTYSWAWPADILHFYGFYFLVAACLFTCSRKQLLWTAAGIVMLFPVMMVLLDYDKGWDWETLTYHGFWTFGGMLRRILFNGFHPVVPWSAFLIFGIWLGRQHLTSPAIQRKLTVQFFFIWAVTESLVFIVRQIVGDGSLLGISAGEVAMLLSTSPIPPLPQYMIAAGSFAALVIVGSLWLTEAFPTSRVLNGLHKTGQLSLTLYIGHVLIGMGVLETMGYLENQSIEFSLFCALSFCLLSIIFSVFWLRVFSVGPMEWLFRKIVS